MTFKSLIKKIFPTNRKLLIKSSLSRLKLNNYNNILVVGAGNDPYRNFFGDPKSYVCLDIIEYKGVTDVIGDAMKLPFDENSFDCVFSSEVFEHLNSPKNFLKEAYRVLIPNGTLVFSVPFIFHIHSDPHDYWRPTKQVLSFLLKDFSHVQIISQGNRLHSILDLISTSSNSIPLFFPLRIINHLVSKFTFGRDSSAPSGYLILAKK